MSNIYIISICTWEAVIQIYTFGIDSPRDRPLKEEVWAEKGGRFNKFT
jgi:hypothetical protein